MTKHEKELLLQDICSRLPYGVKFKYEDRPNVCEILSITPIYNNGNVVYFDRYVNEPKKCSIYDVKPYLFPLSSMTEEQKTSHNFLKYSAHANPVKLVDWYIKNHFDYRGLIPMGLAIDATGKNIY